MSNSLHVELGLTDEEFQEIKNVLKRDPNDLELAMYAVMWSEHCSYKSSRVHLKRLPTTGPRVLVGPGENAGVIDAGDGMAVALRIESHNHPSAIEPTQGAATGAGGILRDIFTMGARPIALLDPLYVGPLDTPRHKWLLESIVRGISSYGNSVGVPTVGGEIHIEPCFGENPLVNVMCVGVMPVERLILAQASGVGNFAILLGSRTGRDGIGGVSVLASQEFNSQADSSAKLPNVQVGDPYEEKRLIEACLELLNQKLVVGIQDLGGAGLTCATSETAARAGLGMDVDINAVPLREPNMNSVEIMTSESQERMLAIVEPVALQDVLDVCRKFEIRATVVGTVTEPENGVGYLCIRNGLEGEILAKVPAKSLADEAPLYNRPLKRPSNLDEKLSTQNPNSLVGKFDLNADIKELLIDESWIYRQYDHQLFLNTVIPPGFDGTLLRLNEPGGLKTSKAVAISTDGNPTWCAIDPMQGTILTVVEGAMNVAVTGSEPVAIVNCLNLGSPEHPEVMWQLSEIVNGMSEACLALGTPVVGGNVSLYNANDGEDIDPTPVIGTLGIRDLVGYKSQVPKVQKSSNENVSDALPSTNVIVLVGGPNPFEESQEFLLGGSSWATKCRNLKGGYLPKIDLGEVKTLIKAIHLFIEKSNAVHDISSGGIGVGLAKLILNYLNTGIEVEGEMSAAALFCELPGRVVLSVDEKNEKSVFEIAGEVGLPIYRLGVARGNRFVVKTSKSIDCGNGIDLEIDELKKSYLGNLEKLVIQ